MSNDIADHQPPECILTVDGAFRMFSSREHVKDWAHELGRNNPNTLIDIYTHAGTLRLTTPPEQENGNAES